MERQQLLRTQLPTQTDSKWFCCWGSRLTYRCPDNPGKVSHACPRASPPEGRGGRPVSLGCSGPSGRIPFPSVSWASAGTGPGVSDTAATVPQDPSAAAEPQPHTQALQARRCLGFSAGPAG